MGKGYQVEDVLKKKIVEGKAYYRIKWKRYPASQNTWEPAEHLTEDLIAYFQDKEEERKQKQENRLRAKQIQGSLHENKRTVVEVKGHALRAQTLIFTVLVNGMQAKYTRQQMLQYFSRQLAEYYLGLAQRTGKY